MRLSIITPVFKSLETLHRTIESVRDQNVAEIEHIIVNDGSPGFDAAYSELLQVRYPEIVIVHQAHQGRSVARNFGATYASSDYLVFLDSDDILLPYYLESILHVLKSLDRSTVLVCGWEERYGIHGISRTDHFQSEFPILEAISKSCPFVIHSAVIPKAVFKQSNGFAVALSFAEDWDLWLRLACADTQFHFIPDILVEYTITPRAYSSDVALQNYLGVLTIINSSFDELERRFVNDTSAQKTLIVSRRYSNLLAIWYWFSGIEAGSEMHYVWLDAEFERLTLNPIITNSYHFEGMYCYGVLGSCGENLCEKKIIKKFSFRNRISLAHIKIGLAEKSDEKLISNHIQQRVRKPNQAKVRFDAFVRRLTKR